MSPYRAVSIGVPTPARHGCGSADVVTRAWSWGARTERGIGRRASAAWWQDARPRYCPGCRSAGPRPAACARGAAAATVMMGDGNPAAHASRRRKGPAMTAPDRGSGVYDDLEAEQDRLDEVLASLGPDDWGRPSAAVGWSVSDVVLHLAQTEELVVASVKGDLAPFAHDPGRGGGGSVDEFAARW